MGTPNGATWSKRKTLGYCSILVHKTENVCFPEDKQTELHPPKFLGSGFVPYFNDLLSHNSFLETEITLLDIVAIMLIMKCWIIQQWEDQ